MIPFGRLFNRTKAKASLRVKNGDALAACAAKHGVTAREAEIIRLLLEGKDNRRITEELFISDHTVKNHIHNIYRKLGIRNRIQLVRCFQAALEEPGRTADGALPAAGPRSLLRRAAVPAVLAAAVLGAALIAWKPWGRWPKPAARPPLPALAVLDFENLSGDPDLEKWVTGFPTLLTTDLLQSRRIRTVGDDAVFGALKKHGLAGSGRFSRAELRRLARELKADYLLCGSLMKAGSAIVVTALLQDARTGATLRTEKIECPDEQSLLREADVLVRLVKSGLGPPAAGAGEDIDLDVEDLTTEYALAYRYYAEALRYHRTGDYEQSLLMLRKAVELDPEFAMAYRLMSVDSRNLGDYTGEAEYMRAAFELSARLPEDSRERHLIRGDYYSLSESTYGLSLEAFRTVLEEHPDDLTVNNNLGMLLYDLEDFEGAVRCASVPILRDTDNPFPYHTKAAALKALGRGGEAVRLLEGYLEKHPANRLVLRTLIEVLIGTRLYPAALEALDRAEAVFPDPYWSELRGMALFPTQGAAAAEAEFRRLFLLEDVPSRLKGHERLGGVALSGGRFRAAAEEFGRGVALAETTAQHDWAATLLRLRSRALLGAGDAAGALAEARKSVEEARAGGGGYRLAFALVHLAETHLGLGDRTAAEALGEQMAALSGPEATPRLRRMADLYRGLVELGAGRPAEAVESLEKAAARVVRRDGADCATAIIAHHLARARERAGDVAGAAHALRAVLEAPGDGLSYEGLLAGTEIGLARLEAKLGNAAAAREAYRRFLALWKDADPGRPEVAEARKGLG